MADPSMIVSYWVSITSWFTPTALFIFVNLVIGTIAITSRRKQPNPHQEDQLGPYDSPPQLARPPSLIDRVKSINFSLYKFPQPEPEQDTRYYPSTEPVHDDSNLVDPPQQLQRAPSLLDRVKSIDLSLYKFKFPQSNPEEETHSFPTTEPVHDSEPVGPYPTQLHRAPSLLERVRSYKLSSVYRSQQPYPEAETEVVDNSVVEEQVSDPKQGLDPYHNQPMRSKSEAMKTKPKKREIVKKSLSQKSMVIDETEIVERRRPETTRAETAASSSDDDEGVDAKADDFINKFRKQLKLQRLDSLLRYKEILQGKVKN
ncbi:hypothetical protein LWI28_007775 [Acer negundo]|uniref:DUF4408 domain-containing protein n=1 Tax=Acer negundo TaxID=4023 RepID=A0AAD5J9R5_ACENE|nr:hypothetical protein LWI28_007775 [Acer negundo]KAK4853762.1 hypothetical protein QYF36_014137 [Acer negundo]